MSEFHFFAAKRVQTSLTIVSKMLLYIKILVCCIYSPKYALILLPFQKWKGFSHNSREHQLNIYYKCMTIYYVHKFDCHCQIVQEIRLIVLVWGDIDMYVSMNNFMACWRQLVFLKATAIQIIVKESMPIRQQPFDSHGGPGGK